MLKIIGIILIFIGGFNIYQYNKVLKENLYIKGTLINFNYSLSRNRYYPIFRYIVEGKVYEEEYRNAYTNKIKIEKIKNIDLEKIPQKARKFIKKLKDINYIEYELGKEYILLVNKTNPKEYWIADDGTSKGREYIWIIVGGAFLLVSLL